MWFYVACLGVRVSVMLHLMFVYYTFSLVWLAEWSTFWERATHLVGHAFSLNFIYLCIKLFLNLVLRAEFGL